LRSDMVNATLSRTYNGIACSGEIVLPFCQSASAILANATAVGCHTPAICIELFFNSASKLYTLIALPDTHKGLSGDTSHCDMECLTQSATCSLATSTGS